MRHSLPNDAAFRLLKATHSNVEKTKDFNVYLQLLTETIRKGYAPLETKEKILKVVVNLIRETEKGVVEHYKQAT